MAINDLSRWAVRGILGAAVLTLPLTGGCGQILGVESSPELLGDKDGGSNVTVNCVGTLRVRITTDDTGTATDIAPPYNYGIYDYLRKLNDKQGGIRGCKIDVDMKDAHYDPAITETVVEAWRQLPEWKEVSTVFVFGTGPTTRVGPRLIEEKKVIIPGSYAGSLASPVAINKSIVYPDTNGQGDQIDATATKTSPGWPYVFFPATDYSTGMRLGIQAAWKISSGRIAMAHEIQDKCLYCVDPLVAGKSYVRQLPKMLLGDDLIIPQTSKPEDGPTILAAVDAYIKKEIDRKKADPKYEPVSWIWSGNSVYASSVLGKGVFAAQKLIDAAGFGATWKLRVMANNWGIGETTPSFCGADCADTFYGLFPVPRYADVSNASGMTDLLNTHDEYRAKDGHPNTRYQDVRYVQGFVAAQMWKKAVEKALDMGHPTPTGEDIKNALETFKEVTFDGLTAGPISFSPQDHRPQSNESIYVIDAKGELRFVDKVSISLDQTWLGY